MKAVQVLAGAGLWLGAMIAGPTQVAVAQENTGELEIVVRSQLLPRVGALSKREATAQERQAVDLGKTYVLLLVERVKSIYPIVKPIDPQAIADEVSRQLDAHGFRKVAPGEKPQIVLTVKYGRGILPNPYYDEDATIDEASADDGLGLRKNIQIRSPRVASRLNDFGVRDRATKAGFEKLFITVRAWKYPTAPSDPPQVLWIASMNVDDPDHRDLNLVYKAMIAEGAPYFGREMKDEEISRFRPLREGRVEVGDPVVVENDAQRDDGGKNDKK